MGEDFFSERRNGSVENRFPGELPGYYIELAGRARSGIGVWCKWSNPAEYASVTRMLTNTSDYTDISTVYLIREIATVRTYVRRVFGKLPYRDKSQREGYRYFSRKKIVDTRVICRYQLYTKQCRTNS